MATEITVPAVGESVSEAVVSAWLANEGDWVEQDSPVVVLETDKANVEVGAPVSGHLSRVQKRAGESVNVGDVVGLMEAAAKPANGGAGAKGGSSDGQAASAGSASAGVPAAPPATPPSAAASAGSAAAAVPTAPPAPPASAGSAAAAVPAPPPSDASPAASAGSASPPSASVGSGSSGSDRQELVATPSARRLMLEAQVDPARVVPSGPAGRVTRDDVKAAMTAPGSATPSSAGAGNASPSSVGPAGAPSQPSSLEEVVRMSPLRKKVAQRLVEAQQTAALLTTFNEVDMSAILDLRKKHGESFQKKHGVKLGFMSFFVKAAVEALKSWPVLNAEVRGDDMVFRNYYHIGVAVGSDRGLVVPVVRGADRLSFAEVEKTIGDLALRARAGRLKLEELQGGTFTITNGGIYGSLLSTPIVNPPQSGILGMHKIEERPVARGGQVVIRPMMYLAVTYDHRIVDGREAVSFLVQLRELLEDPSRILLEV